MAFLVVDLEVLPGREGGERERGEGKERGRGREGGVGGWG